MVIILLVAALILKNQIWTSVDASQVVVVQYPSGKLSVIQTPGAFNLRLFGSVTPFRRSSQYYFSAKPDEGNSADQSIKTRFNDGASGWVSGSVRYDLPLAESEIIDLYKTYSTQSAIDKELVGQAVTKAIYMTGSLMSSKESSQTRRNELINDIEDQAIGGVYKTTPTMVEVEDPMSGGKKWVSSVKIDVDPKTGLPSRQEVSPLARFGIKLYGVSINDVKYDDVVEQQIAAQQAALGQVQTAMSKAKEAEQQKITAIANGEADAAKAKWEQEVIKARAVTAAEQEAEVQKTNADRDKLVAETKAQQDLDVAKFAHQAAEETKLQQIALGEGEATRKKLVMAADGALEVKTRVWLQAQEFWANAFKDYRGSIVPSIVSGGGAATGSTPNPFGDYMSILSMKAAKDLNLDMSMKPIVANTQSANN